MHHSPDYIGTLAPGYFSRILQQRDTLHRYVARISRHDFSCLNDFFEATQRIALDAPVFGFEEIGEVAQDLHDLISSFSAAPCCPGIERLASLLLEFDDVVYCASESNRPAPAPRKPLHHMAPLAQMVA